MKKTDISRLLDLAAGPALQILLGLLLLIHPDGAVALVFRLVGWILVAAALFQAISLAKTARPDAGKVLLAAVCGLGGALLIQNPLILLIGTGKLLGVVLILRGVGGLGQAAKNRQVGGSYILDTCFGIAILAVGLWLLISPMAPSRLILGLVGAGLIIAGVVKLVAGRSELRSLDRPSDPRIIDADE